MTKLPEELPYIDPRMLYPIGKASELVFVCTKTLRQDARRSIIPYKVSEKNGRMRFLGRDLIHYRDFIR